MNSNGFVLGGTYWRVQWVPPYSDYLIDRTGTKTVATTDPVTHCIYLSDDLDGEFMFRVVVHEMCHAAMVSFDLLKDIRRMVYPSKWIEAEEWVCNLLADYGLTIFRKAYSVLGYDALRLVPRELERLIA